VKKTKAIQQMLDTQAEWKEVVKKANAKALAKHQKFQEEWQEEQAKDIEEMDRLGLDHPFKTKKRIEDDDYQERGLHRSDFIDNEFI